MKPTTTPAVPNDEPRQAVSGAALKAVVSAAAVPTRAKKPGDKMPSGLASRYKALVAQVKNFRLQALRVSTHELEGHAVKLRAALKDYRDAAEGLPKYPAPAVEDATQLLGQWTAGFRP